MAKRVDLMIIDGQNDFCASGNEPDDWPRPFGGKHRPGALYVTGADEEATKVANMIKRIGKQFARIHASLDSHHLNDGSHNTSWRDRLGNTAPPFTIVTHEAVKNREFTPALPYGYWEGKIMPSYDWALIYTEKLEQDGRCPLCLWPPHCVIQGWGLNCYWPLQEAYDYWCDQTGSFIDFITKGQWPFTEHYSALRADVIDSTRIETQLNTDVLDDADKADLIGWCGWAGSHCTRWTALDAINYFGVGENPFLKKSVFLEDACAPVPSPPGGPDFAQWRAEFLDEVKRRGAAISTTEEFLR